MVFPISEPVTPPRVLSAPSAAPKTQATVSSMNKLLLIVPPARAMIPAYDDSAKMLFSISTPEQVEAMYRSWL